MLSILTGVIPGEKERSQLQRRRKRRGGRGRTRGSQGVTPNQEAGADASDVDASVEPTVGKTESLRGLSVTSIKGLQKHI